MKPNFKDINIKDVTTGVAPEVASNWLTPELIPVKTILYKRRYCRHRAFELCSRSSSLFAWSVQRNVRHATLDNPPVCRILHC